MARPREYDPDAVLNAAVQRFWRHGYEGTSIRDLVDACGLTTRSMYDAFGGKERFFEAALDRYHEQMLSPILEMLRTHRGLAALERFMSVLAENATSDGCLFVNTGAERHHVTGAALERIERYFTELRRVFRTKLEEARVDGAFRGDADARATQLYVTVIGVMMSLRCGCSRKDAASTLRLLLSDLARN